MPWVYQQATGHLFLNTIFIGTGYCGHGSGLNNPAAQDQQNVGPIPTGSYAIGPAHTPVDHLGPLALPLYPDPTNQMYSRFGFFMHGDNQYANHSASNGCIILGPEIRRQVSSSDDKTLVVVSGIASHQQPLTDRLIADPQQQALIDRLLAPSQQQHSAGPSGRDRLISTQTMHDALDALFRATTPVNAYPELPALPFHRTSVTMEEVVNALNASDHATNVKRASYVMFRNESGNGTKGINNNYCGAQADSGRWPESLTSLFSGTVTIRENGTQRLRIFLAFKTMPGNLEFLMNRVLSRGLYIGGQTHLVLTMAVHSEDDLARAYHKEWVSGSATSEPSAREKADFLSMYRQAEELIA
ncbi:MAG TPA: tlde1 domain-containing protein [Acetobacteraceae bacterium]|nr:tlde1 domain-containing protein [Acetobacteraceae bacterium]